MLRPMRIVVIDDHPLILEGIANLLRNAGHQVVAATAETQGLLALLAEKRVDAVTLDIGMPGLNGIELARQIRAKFPGIRIVFVTQQTDTTYLRTAMQVGAHAFVSKQSASTELVAALDAVAQRRSYISPGLIDAPVGLRTALSDLQQKRSDVLTPRQREVLQQIAEGKSVKEIAAALGISAKTVEFHKQALVNTLNIKTTAELTRYAITHGLTFLAR